MTGTARDARADRTPQLPRARKRRVRTPLETIAVTLATHEAADHSAWRARLVAIGRVPSRLLPFASWYRPAVERWVTIATEQGMWGPGDEWESTRAEDFRRPDYGLEHHTGDDGQTVHLEVEEDDAGARLIARFCRTAGPASPKHTFAEEQRLSWEEFIAGTPCRGCGRGFAGGPESKLIRDRTPEEQAAHDAEEAAFRALHPDCSPARWSISGGGITHCSVCCPPPPFGPEQSERLAKLLVDIAIGAATRDADLERRWAAQAGKDPAPDVERLDTTASSLAILRSVETDRPRRAVRVDAGEQDLERHQLQSDGGVVRRNDRG